MTLKNYFIACRESIHDLMTGKSLRFFIDDKRRFYIFILVGLLGVGIKFLPIHLVWKLVIASLIAFIIGAYYKKEYQKWKKNSEVFYNEPGNKTE